jgi:lipopolysaccharide export LptBFGC system permease protein LptF
LVDGQRLGPRGISEARWLGMAGLTPELLWRTGKEAREAAGLSYSELLDLRSLRPGRRDFVLAFHSHLTFPIANLILLMLALPFAVHFDRSSRAERVLFAVAVCAAYLVADLTCQTLGRTGDLHPVFAAWLPTIVFGSLGVVFFGSVRT